MEVAYCFGDLEFGSEQCGDCFRRIPLDWQAAALRGTIQRKRPDDRSAANPEGLAQVLDVCITLFNSRQEMQHRTIVPDVDRWNGPSPGYVRLDPGDEVGSIRKTITRTRESGFRDVENRDARQSSVEKMVDEAGISAPYVDDSRTGPDASPFQQVQ